MKKVLSIILSLVMAVSVGMLATPVFAVVGSQETTAPITHNKIIPQVNGKDDGSVKYDWVSDDPKQIKFTYDGDGTLEDWEFGDLEEGVDYKVIDRDGNTITIELMDATYDGDIIANAIVDEEEEEESTTEEEEEEEEDETTTTQQSPTTTQRNEGTVSPKTGATAAAGIAALGAGVAILTAIKKKED